MCKLSLIVDMGTSNTVIVERKQGRVVEEPTLIAVKKVGGKMRTVAVGKEAYKMKISKHKPHDVYYVYPVKDGNVVNSEAACLMLKAFIERITKPMIVRPQIDVICVVSCGLHTTERLEFENVFYHLGIKTVTLLEAPIAAASSVVAGCSFVVVMGGGVTDIAIVKENGIATGCSVSISGAKMQEAIYEYVYRHYNVTISQARAEQLLNERSTLFERENGVTLISGKDVATGDYKKIEISSQDVRNAILPIVNALVDSIIAMSKLCPENLADSLKHGGLQLYGGLSGIRYLDTYLTNQLNLAVEVHPDVSSVARGAAVFFDDRAKLYRMIGLRGE